VGVPVMINNNRPSHTSGYLKHTVTSY